VSTPGYEAPLSNLSEWRNPFWSSISQQKLQSSGDSTDSQSKSVEVNAFIHKVNSDYVMSDSEYVEVLQALREAPLEGSPPSER
jgi:hypothetical protein